MTQEKKHQPMGIGLLGSPTITFVRKFRYTLEAPHLPKDFVVSTKIDYQNRTLSFVYYDVQDKQDAYHALKWAQAMEHNLHPDERLTLKTYDACGGELYTVIFDKLTLLEHTSDFDYATSDMSCQNIKVQFENYVFVNNASEEVKIHHNSNVQCKNFSLNETELSFMGDSIFIPGRPLETVK